MYDSSPRQKQSSEAYGYQDSYYTTAPRQPRTRSQTRLNSEFAPNANDYPVYSQSSKSLDKSQRARSLDAVRGAASQEDIGRQISGPRGNNGPQGGVTIPIRIERGPARTFDQDRERDHRRVENSQNYNAGYNIGSRRPTAENNPYQRQGHRAYDDPSPRSYDDSMIMKSSRNYDSPSMPRIQRPHPDDTAILKPRGFEESAVQSHGRYYEDDVAMRAPRGYDDGYIPRSQRNYDDAPMMRREWSSSLDRLDRRMQDSSKRSPNMLNRSYGNARDFKLDTRPSFGPRYPAGYKESGGGGQGYRQHSSYHYESGGGPTSHGAMVSQPPSPHRRGIISQQPQAMNTMGRRTAGGHENMMITSSSGAHHHQQQQVGLHPRKYHRVKCCCFSFTWPLWSYEPTTPPQPIYRNI